MGQRRHPFSLAHYANHPPAGRRPNIMIAAYDFREGPGASLGLSVTDTESMPYASSSADLIKGMAKVTWSVICRWLEKLYTQRDVWSHPHSFPGRLYPLR